MRLHEQVAFASVDLLVAVETVRTALLGRLRRWAVNDGGAGLGVMSDLQAHYLAQGAVDPLPRPMQPPGKVARLVQMVEGYGWGCCRKSNPRTLQPCFTGLYHVPLPECTRMMSVQAAGG